MNKLKFYFDTYPQSNECFETSDGFLFHKEHEAKTQARTLEDKEVKHWQRKDIEAEKTIKDVVVKTITEAVENATSETATDSTATTQPAKPKKAAGKKGTATD